MMVSGTVEVTKGEVEKDRLLKNMETFIRLSDYHKAADVSAQIINEYPDDYRGWYGQAQALTHNFTGEDFDSVDFPRVAALIEKALNTAPQEQQNVIGSVWKEYSSKRERFLLDRKEKERIDQSARKERDAKIKKLEKQQGLFSFLVGFVSTILIAGGLDPSSHRLGRGE